MLHPSRAARPAAARRSRASRFYTAPNPPFGAVFTYYLKDDLKTPQEAAPGGREEAADKEGGIARLSRRWEALRAEEREEEPAMLLIVTDEEGNVVRRLTAPAKAGFHRVAWDLRFPPPTPVELDEPASRDVVRRRSPERPAGGAGQVHRARSPSGSTAW